MSVEKCPTCGGQKHVSKPPMIDGDVDHWVDNCTGGYPCPTCDGKGYLVVD
jgi:DnaJ-class molecular chaperone